MGSRLDRIAEGLLRPTNPYTTIILGIMTAAWGIWILMPWDTFGSAKLFSKMSEFAPEWAWGTWSILCGILLIIAIFKGLYSFLARTLMFSLWHWSAVSAMMWWGDWHNTGGLTYTFFAVYCAYRYFNIKINYVKFGEDIPNFYTN